MGKKPKYIEVGTSLDWYSYLTREFKLDRKVYRVNERYPFSCPRCKISTIKRLNHVKRKIKDLGYYECSKCRKQDSVGRARVAFKEKHGDMNPFQLEGSKKKIKKTLLEKYGVDCVLKMPEIRNKKAIERGLTNVSQLPEVKAKVKKTMDQKYGGYNIDVFRELASKMAWTKEIKTKREKTNIQKYGKAYAINTEKSKAASRSAFKERYGVEYIGQSKELMQKSINAKKLIASNLRKKWKSNGGKVCPNCNEFKTLKEYSRIKYQCSICKSCHNKKVRERFDSDPLYKLAYNIRCLPTRIIKNLNRKKCKELMGCDVEFLRDYLESQFLPGMTWNNWSYDGWHLDHIIPVSKADFSNDEHIDLVSNYKNLQPLWSKDNVLKSDKTPKVIILTGCFGSGKTTIVKKLNYKFVFDKDLKHDIYDVGKVHWESTAVYQSSMKVTKDINLFSQFFEIEVIIVDETIEIIKNRILARGGNFNESTIKKRINRMKGIAKKYGTFSGTADECLNYLINRLS